MKNLALTILLLLFLKTASAQSNTVSGHYNIFVNKTFKLIDSDTNTPVVLCAAWYKGEITQFQIPKFYIKYIDNTYVVTNKYWKEVVIGIIEFNRQKTPLPPAY